MVAGSMPPRAPVTDVPRIEIGPLVRAALSGEPAGFASLVGGAGSVGWRIILGPRPQLQVEVPFAAGVPTRLVELSPQPMPRRGGVRFCARCPMCEAGTRSLYVAADGSVSCRVCAGARFHSRRRSRRAQAAARAAAAMAELGASPEASITDVPPPRATGRWRSRDAALRTTLAQLVERYRDRCRPSEPTGTMAGGDDVTALGVMYQQVRWRLDLLIECEHANGRPDPEIARHMRLAVRLLTLRQKLRHERRIGTWLGEA